MGDRFVVAALAAADATGRTVQIPANSILVKCVLSREEEDRPRMACFGPYIVSFVYQDKMWYIPLYSFQARTSCFVDQSTHDHRDAETVLRQLVP